MQKTILALHDLSGFGRSSLVPIIGALSAAGHQCVPLPTAVYSTHTAIPGWVSTDLTAAMAGTIDQYERLGLRFDAVYAGFLASAAQIDLVADAVHRLRASDALVLIDPVMGDDGKIYQTYTPDLCTRMRELCTLADLITPNVTEAAVLLDAAPDCAPQSEAEALEWLRALQSRYGGLVALTGLCDAPDEIGVGIASADGAQIVRTPRAAGSFPGTGDLFAATLLGRLLQGKALAPSVRFAADFVRACIEHTLAVGGAPAFGVQFEHELHHLMA